MPTIIQSTLVTGGGNGTFSGTLTSITGNDVLIVIAFSLRDYGAYPYYSATWNGVGMFLRHDELVAMGGFGQGSAAIWSKTAGNVSGLTADGSVTISFGDSSTQWMFRLMAISGIDQSSSFYGSTGGSLASAASTSTLIGATSIPTVDVISVGYHGTPTVAGSGHTNLGSYNNSGTGRDVLTHAAGYNFTGITNTWNFSSSSYCHALVGFNVAPATPPTITTVDVDNAIVTTQTNMAIVGTNFAPGGVTKVFYANTSVYASATKVDQSISSVTSTTINWVSVTLGALPGAATRYIFVVTDYGGGSEQVSAAKAITVTVPPTPVITSITGGSTVDVTDTNRVVNGTDFVSVGTTALYLADGTTFATATKVLQGAASITGTSLTWTAVTLGAITPGARYIFVVSDNGGANQTPSAAFAITLTEPTVPAIATVDGGASQVYPTRTSIAVTGTNFNPGGTTQFWWADSASLATAVKSAQTYSALTGTTFTWSSVALGSVGEGQFYLFVVTYAGAPKERTSAPFPFKIASAVPATITSVDGSDTIYDTYVGMTLNGSLFTQPGTFQLWYADGPVFATATKVLQTTGTVTATTAAWPALIQGSIDPTGSTYLFVVTDAGGANEQVSIAYLLTVLTSESATFITFTGDANSGFLGPVLGDSAPEPSLAVSILRDHMCWTGLGVWYYARDFFKYPTPSPNLNVTGGYTGPLTGSQAIELTTLPSTSASKLRNNELLNMFTEAARYTFSVGLWINVANVDAGVDALSIFKLVANTGTSYLEVKITRDGASKFVVSAVSDNAGTVQTKTNTMPIVDATLMNGYAFVVCKFKYGSTPRFTINVGGSETTFTGTDPYVGLHNITEIASSISTALSDPVPTGVRLSQIFYGFKDLTTANITTLRTSGTLATFETNLRSLFGTAGPIHYYRTNDKVPDRFVHNHAGSIGQRGEAIGGTFTRGILVGTYGGLAAYTMRFQAGCVGDAPVGASFATYGATMVGHFRFVGASGDTGTLMMLQAANGATFKLSKTTPGGGPNEANGRLRVIVESSPGVYVTDETISSPVSDPFNGLFHTLAVTTGSTPSTWKVTMNGVTIWTTALGSIPAWHGNSYTLFRQGGVDVDAHSVGYQNSYDATAHSTWHTWSSVYDLLLYMQNNGYKGAFWNQNVRAND